MGEKYDFSGWATKNDLLCSDGRTIRRGAFKECDGIQVPLVWNHGHKDPTNVLGHALLENRAEGVYAYCKFNNTPKAQHIKEAVKNGDLNGLSIYANQLVQKAGDVFHGAIREVSLVLSRANPGATIDTVLAHSDEIFEGYGYAFDEHDRGIITSDEPIVLYHSDDDPQAPETEETKEDAMTEQELMHADEKDEEEKKPASKPDADDAKDDGKTVKDVFDTLNDEQKEVVYFMIGQAVEDAKGGSDDEEEKEMKHNVFEGDNTQTLVHSLPDMQDLLEQGRKMGSLKDAFLAHCEEMNVDAEEALMHAEHSTDTPSRYGIMPKMNGTTPVPGSLGIEALFPDAKYLNGMPPEFIKRDTGWVDGVINGVHHTPFSRFKTMFADITEDEARARGYMKGNYKKEEVFSLLKREITPQTIYKKQRFDRDDLIDITDFDVLSWVKAEMRMMLDEEIGRAILVGDGRLDSSDDKIMETHVKPIYHDDDFYANKVAVKVANNADDDAIAKATVRAIIKARKDYKGSGNPVFYTTADVLTNMLLLEDGIGHRLYKTEQELATALRVSKIVEVEIMEGLTRTFTEGTTAKTLPLIGIVVNLKDYTVGADKGGNVAMFDDFDIDYNQQKYLIETRLSGMLTKPHSAMVIELDKSAAAQG